VSDGVTLLSGKRGAVFPAASSTARWTLLWWR